MIRTNMSSIPWTHRASAQGNPDPKVTNSQYMHAQGRALFASDFSLIQMFYYLLLEIYTLALAYFASIVLLGKIEIQK